MFDDEQLHNWMNNPPRDENAAALRDAAVAQFQLYQAYLAAGFSEDQATQLLVAILKGMSPNA